MSAKRKREVWIDVAKGIAIALVALGHSQHLLTLSNMPVDGFWLWVSETFASVRMPAFFMISGFFLYRWKERGWKAFVQGKIRGFIYLYFVWAAIYFVVDGLLVRHLDPRVLHLTRSGPVEHILRIDTPLWYLIALPLFSLIWWLTRSWPAWLPVAIASIGFFGTQFGVLHFPSPISTVGTIGFAHYLFAFLVGARATGIIRSLVPKAKLWHFIAFVTVWMLFVFVWPDVPAVRFFVAVPSLFLFAALLARSERASRPFLIMGQHSLPIYVTHWQLLTILLGISLRWIEQWPPWTGIITTPLLWAASILLAMGIWNLTKHWGWLWARPELGPAPDLPDDNYPPLVNRPSGFQRLQ